MLSLQHSISAASNTSAVRLFHTLQTCLDQDASVRFAFSLPLRMSAINELNFSEKMHFSRISRLFSRFLRAFFTGFTGFRFYRIYRFYRHDFTGFFFTGFLPVFNLRPVKPVNLPVPVIYRPNPDTYELNKSLLLKSLRFLKFENQTNQTIWANSVSQFAAKMVTRVCYHWLNS